MRLIITGRGVYLFNFHFSVDSIHLFRLYYALLSGAAPADEQRAIKAC